MTEKLYKKKFSLIVAFDENKIIGKSGGSELLWHFKKDLAFFQKKTLGHIVIMGSNTFWSLPESARPLRGRNNLVLTNSDTKCIEDEFDTSQDQSNTSIFAGGLREVLSYAENLQDNTCKKVFVIGGASVYELFLQENFIDTIYATRIRKDFSKEAGGNAVRFPEFENAFHKVDECEDLEDGTILKFELWCRNEA